MALKKWEIGKEMSAQLADQNKNFDEIGKGLASLKAQYISDSTLSNSDWLNLIKKNWASIATGVSTLALVAGTSGAGAVGFKSSENYGQFIVFGNLRTPDFVQCNNGNFAQTKLGGG